MFIFLLSFVVLQGKVYTISYAYNRPDFIDHQLKLIRRLLQDEFRFVVFNDAVAKGLKSEIEKVCLNVSLFLKKFMICPN